MSRALQTRFGQVIPPLLHSFHYHICQNHFDVLAHIGIGEIIQHTQKHAGGVGVQTGWQNSINRILGRRPWQKISNKILQYIYYILAQCQALMIILPRAILIVDDDIGMMSTAAQYSHLGCTLCHGIPPLFSIPHPLLLHCLVCRQ